MIMRNNAGCLLGAIAAVVVAVIAVVIGWHVEYGTERTVQFTVQSVDDQATSKGHQYLVFTTAGQVYRDTDSILHGKTDSSNVYALLDHPGETFRCPVYGFRIFWMSSYPDILDGCKQVSS